MLLHACKSNDNKMELIKLITKTRTNEREQLAEASRMNCNCSVDTTRRNFAAHAADAAD